MDMIQLRQKLEDEKRNKLAQQTAPVYFATGDRNQPTYNDMMNSPMMALRNQIAGSQAGNQKTIPLNSLRNKKIPYTVDKEDYEGYPDLVKAYTGTRGGKDRNGIHDVRGREQTGSSIHQAGDE